MASMKKPIYVPHECLTDYLNSTYTNAQTLAKAAGVTTQYAYDLLSGSSTPSMRILNALGLQVRYEVVK